MTAAASIPTETVPRSDSDSSLRLAIKGAVLLVDDDPGVLRSIARALRAEGYAVTTAEGGEEALQYASLVRFDVVVSDISMPDLDGLELLRRIRDIDLSLPVVLLTGSPAVSTAAEAVEFGAFRYLSKPVENEALAATLDRAIGYHRMARMKARAADLLGTAGAPGDRAGLEVRFERMLETMWIAFQPIVDAKNGKIFGHEALLRSREHSLPHPGAVLDAAERLDMLDVLGRTVRDRATAPVLSDPGCGVLFVNLHVQDLLDPTLTSPDSALSKIADRVVLEITERAALEQVGDVRGHLEKLRSMGFRIAVDDLGAGYAGLASFALLEPEVVKLDMSLVRDIDQSPTKQKVVRSMTTLSQDMGILVVAEGVETRSERDMLASLGCDLLQGFLFAKPGPPFPEVSW